MEKLKEVLWKVFDGKEFHRNQVETAQMSLFTEEDETEHFSKRKEMKNLIQELKKVNPYVEKNIFKSAQNVNITQIISYFNDDKHYHFLDTYDKEKKDE